MGILTEGFSAYSSPVMLISRKLTKDKRVVTDFRHLNVRIAKNNLAYPLVRDTFSVLGSSKCEVLSVLDLKDAFHSLRLSENLKRYCRILPYFGSSSYLYQRMPMGLNISLSIWQSYINAILDCLQSKKYCEAIMDININIYAHAAVVSNVTNSVQGHTYNAIPSVQIILGQLDGSLLARDQDGEWEGELPNASNSCRSFALWDGASMWPSIWRLAPDVLSPRSLDLAAIDMKLVAVN